MWCLCKKFNAIKNQTDNIRYYATAVTDLESKVRGPFVIKANDGGSKSFSQSKSITKSMISEK